MSEPIFTTNCPIRERTADGISVGRCWYYLPDGHTCPRHGDVSAAVDRYKRTGRLTDEHTIRAAQPTERSEGR